MSDRIDSARKGLVYHLRRQLNLNQVPCGGSERVNFKNFPEMGGVNQEQIIDVSTEFDNYCPYGEWGHATRVAIYLGKTAYALRMSPEQSTFLMALGAYHDCGKKSTEHLKSKKVLTLQEIEEIRQMHVGPYHIHGTALRFGNDFASAKERHHSTDGYPKEFVIPMTPESRYASILLEAVDKFDAGISRKERNEERWLSFDEVVGSTKKSLEKSPRVEYNGDLFPQREIMTAKGLVDWAIINNIFEKPRRGFIFRRNEEEARMNPWG